MLRSKLDDLERTQRLQERQLTAWRQAASVAAAAAAVEQKILSSEMQHLEQDNTHLTKVWVEEERRRLLAQRETREREFQREQTRAHEWQQERETHEHERALLKQKVLSLQAQLEQTEGALRERENRVSQREIEYESRCQSLHASRVALDVEHGRISERERVLEEREALVARREAAADKADASSAEDAGRARAVAPHLSIAHAAGSDSSASGGGGGGGGRGDGARNVDTTHQYGTARLAADEAATELRTSLVKALLESGERAEALLIAEREAATMVSAHAEELHRARERAAALERSLEQCIARAEAAEASAADADARAKRAAAAEADAAARAQVAEAECTAATAQKEAAAVDAAALIRRAESEAATARAEAAATAAAIHDADEEARASMTHAAEREAAAANQVAIAEAGAQAARVEAADAAASIPSVIAPSPAPPPPSPSVSHDHAARAAFAADDITHVGFRGTERQTAVDVAEIAAASSSASAGCGDANTLRASKAASGEDALSNWELLADRVAALGANRPPPALRDGVVEAPLGTAAGVYRATPSSAAVGSDGEAGSSPPLREVESGECERVLHDVCSMLRVGHSGQLIGVLAQVVRVATTIPELERAHLGTENAHQGSAANHAEEQRNGPPRNVRGITCEAALKDTDGSALASSAIAAPEPKTAYFADTSSVDAENVGSNSISRAGSGNTCTAGAAAARGGLSMR